MGEGNIVPFCILVFMAINLFAMGGAQQNVFKTRSGEEDKEQSMFKLTDSLVKDLIERVNQLEEENRQRQLEFSAQNRIILQQQHEINGLKKNMATQVENQYQPDKADVSSMLTEYYDENGSQINEELSQSANTGPDTGTTDEVPSRPRRASPGLEVAFFATLNRTQAHIGRLQSVVFDQVETNIGNGYDQYTGVFSAPTSGVYVFSTTISTLVANSLHYGVFQNGKKKTVMWVNGFQNNYDSSSHTVILKLLKGDDVTIKHTGSDKSVVNGDLHSMFSGFLLYQADVGGPAFVGK